MKINNLRPTRPEDSLRKLLNRVDQSHTVPFGQKAASSTEGINYQTSTGSSYRWDGDAVADYDKRITEGQQAIAEATADLAEAEGNINAAKDRIAAVEADTTPEAIGDTAAGQINSRRLIVGRDAILTGTVDVAQLNVTEQMSAAVVDAMSVDAKKLVVTEDAILNRATVVESLVTPELVADRINVQNLGAQLVTSGALQTDTLANRGIKITTGGIKGYDETGKTTIDINGKNNTLIGNLRTNATNEAGVIISSSANAAAIDLFPNNTSTTGNQHGAIWYDKGTSVADANLYLGSTLYSQRTSTDPLIILGAGVKGISFNSRIVTGSAMKFGVLSAPNGMGADQWISFDVKFAEAMPNITEGASSEVMVFMQVVTVNNNEVATGFGSSTYTGFKGIVKNVSGRATGATWIKWMAVNTGIVQRY